MSVEVREGSSGGAIVDNAIVSVKGDSNGTVTIPWTGVAFNGHAAGAYLQNPFVWDKGFELSVKRGSDELNAYLEAPGITNITAPVDGSTFNRADGNPLKVQWNDSFNRRAHTVRIDAKQVNFSWEGGPDELSYPIEANRLVADNNEHLAVSRTNSVDLAGGTPGSMFEAQTSHSIHITVQ